jgi:uncharacterized protein
MMPWANGRGITREVVAHPAVDEWIWRVSIARVDEDGPFSLLPGVDRALAVASGRGMTLNIDGERNTVGLYESIEFSGDAQTTADLVRGPIDDVNLMVRRGRGTGRPLWRIERREAGQTIDLGDALVAIVLDGAVSLSAPSESFPFSPVQERATRFDALFPSPDPSVTAAVTKAAVVAFALIGDDASFG